MSIRQLLFLLFSLLFIQGTKATATSAGSQPQRRLQNYGYNPNYGYPEVQRGIWGALYNLYRDYGYPNPYYYDRQPGYYRDTTSRAWGHYFGNPPKKRLLSYQWS